MSKTKVGKIPANVGAIFTVTGVKDPVKKEALEKRIYQLLDKLEQDEDVKISHVAQNPNGSLAVGILIGIGEPKEMMGQTSLLIGGRKR